MTAAIVQVGLQWALFSFIFVLYIIYYPQHLKHQTLLATPVNGKLVSGQRRTKEWESSVVLAWVTIAHLVLTSIVTIYLLSSSAFPAPTPPRTLQWATLLGVISAMLAAIQYAPQLFHTYRAKLVGALSIPMMLIQSPGAVLMVLSIALRPGTNWTSWITFAVAGLMQGSLLIMCIIWKFRQRRLHIDDFGHPLSAFPSSPSDSHRYTDSPLSDERPEEEVVDVPGLVVDPDDDPVAVRDALVDALESAVEEDVRSGGVGEGFDAPHEQTPLLTQGGSGDAKSNKGWLGLW